MTHDRMIQNRDSRQIEREEPLQRHESGRLQLWRQWPRPEKHDRRRQRQVKEERGRCRGRGLPLPRQKPHDQPQQSQSEYGPGDGVRARHRVLGSSVYPLYWTKV